MGGSIGGISIDKDKVDAWTASMRGAFGSEVPPALTIGIIIGLTVIVVAAVWWITSMYMQQRGRRRHA